MKKRLMAAAVALFVSSAPVSAAPVQNEIMFMLDSSGGLNDRADSNWNAQIGWVQNFINQTHRADGSNVYGSMTFAGLSSSYYSYAQNIAGNGLQGGAKVLHSLRPGAENPQPDGPLNPSSDLQPADPDTGYVSPVLQALQASDANLAAVPIAGQTGVQTDMLNTMISDPRLLLCDRRIRRFLQFSAFVFHCHAATRKCCFSGPFRGISDASETPENVRRVTKLSLIRHMSVVPGF